MIAVREGGGKRNGVRYESVNMSLAGFSFSADGMPFQWMISLVGRRIEKGKNDRESSLDIWNGCYIP